MPETRFSAEDERRFRSVYVERSIPFVRVSLPLAAMLYLLFLQWDALIDPQSIPATLAVRLPFCALALLVFASTYSPIFVRIAQATLASLVVLGAAGVLAVLAILPDGFMLGVAGLILVVMYACGFLRLLFVPALIACAVIIAMANAVLLLDMWTLKAFVNLNFFLIAAIVVGLSYSKLLEWKERREFLLQADIGELKRTQSSLEASERKYRELIENSSQGILIHRDGEPLFANRSLAQMLGYGSVADLLALGSAFDIIPEEIRESTISTHLRHLRGAIESARYEHQVTRQDGSVGWVESRAEQIEWENLPAVQISLTDITERHDVDRLKDEFVSTVSHELRTPLTSIRGSLAIIGAGMVGPLSDKASDLLALAERNSIRLEKLINDVLDLQRIESGLANELSTRSILARDITDMAVEDTLTTAGNNGVRIGKRFDGEDSVISADPEQLTRALSNLISNAIKASPKGGNVEVYCSVGDNEVTFGVTDQGPGVPGRIRSRLFQRFVRGEQVSGEGDGYGLGLSICRSIIERHGGWVGFNSGSQGSEFFFSLPRSRASAGPGLAREGSRATGLG